MNHSTVGDKSARRMKRVRKMERRRLLLEHLETRQLLAGDILRELLPPDPFQSQIERLPATDSSHHMGQKNGRGDSNNDAVRHQFNTTDSLANNNPRANGFGSTHNGRDSRGNRGHHSTRGSQLDYGLDTAIHTSMTSAIAGGFGSSLASPPIGLRMTSPATLPELPSGYELVDRYQIAPPNTTLPLSSSASSQSGFEALVIADNNSKPPELILVAVEPGQDSSDAIQSTIQEREASRSRLPDADSQTNATGLANDDRSGEAVDASAFDAAMNEIFSSDETLAASTVDDISGQMQEFVNSADPQASVSAFVKSISSDLRRKGISQRQIAELEILLQQIVASEGSDDANNSAFDRYRANQLASHSRTGVVFYDLRDAMMAVPIDESAVVSDPVDSILSTSQAWTQRFGLADVALVELAGFATGSEMARVNVSGGSGEYDYTQWDMGERFEAALDILPQGLVEGVWRPTIAKASLVVVACLAGMRTQQRPVNESKATRKRPK